MMPRPTHVRLAAGLVLLLLAAPAAAGSDSDTLAALLPCDVVMTFHAPTIRGLDDALAAACELAGEPVRDHAVLMDMISSPALDALTDRLDPDGPLCLALGTPNPFGGGAQTVTAVFRTDLSPEETEAALAGLAADPSLSGRVGAGGLVAVSTDPDYVPCGGMADLVADLPADDLSLRMDLAAIVAALRPMVEYGLGAMAATAAQPADPGADPPVAPPLTPAQAEALGEAVHGLMDSLDRLDVGLDVSGDEARLHVDLDVIADSPLEPGPQPAFDRALRLTRLLPRGADQIQAGCGDYSAAMDMMMEFERTVLTAESADGGPSPELLTRWLDAYAEAKALLFVPHAFVLNYGPEAMGLVGVLAPPDAAAAAAWLVETLDTLPLDELGVTLTRRPDIEFDGLETWSWILDLDGMDVATFLTPPPGPGVATPPTGLVRVPNPGPGEILSRLPSHLTFARHGDRLLFAFDDSDAAFVALAAAARRGGGHDDARIAAVAREAGSVCTDVSVSDLAPYLRVLASMAPAGAGDLSDVLPEDATLDVTAVCTVSETGYGSVLMMDREEMRLLGRVFKALEAADSE